MPNGPLLLVEEAVYETHQRHLLVVLGGVRRDKVTLSGVDGKVKEDGPGTVVGGCGGRHVVHINSWAVVDPLEVCH